VYPMTSDEFNNIASLLLRFRYSQLVE
jgi:hypothetical protein